VAREHGDGGVEGLGWASRQERGWGWEEPVLGRRDGGRVSLPFLVVHGAMGNGVIGRGYLSLFPAFSFLSNFPEVHFCLCRIM